MSTRGGQWWACMVSALVRMRLSEMCWLLTQRSWYIDNWRTSSDAVVALCLFWWPVQPKCSLCLAVPWNTTLISLGRGVWLLKSESSWEPRLAFLDKCNTGFFWQRPLPFRGFPDAERAFEAFGDYAWQYSMQHNYAVNSNSKGKWVLLPDLTVNLCISLLYLTILMDINVHFMTKWTAHFTWAL